MRINETEGRFCASYFKEEVSNTLAGRSTIMCKRRGFAPLEIVQRIANSVHAKRSTLTANLGFTLIELLVVISIIALLMSILMPSLTKAKKTAQAAVCLSNLHQLGIACDMYAQDNKGLMPDQENFDWVPKLKPYYQDEELLICPSAKKTKDDGWGNKFYAWVEDWDMDGDGVEEDVIGSYGINMFLSQNSGGGRAGKLWGPVNILKGAAYVPAFSDSAMDEDSPLAEDNPPEYDGQVYGAGGGTDEMRDRCLNRHNEAINVLFADWHTRKAGLKELWELRWHPDWIEDRAAAGEPDWTIGTGWMLHMKRYATD